MLTEKRIVITGAGSGIGRATSILAAGYGAKIVCVDLSDSVNSTVEEIVHNGGAATAVQADVSDETAVADFIAQCVTLYGGIDGIYANAGVSGAQKPDRINRRGLATHSSREYRWRFLAIKHSVPHFVNQGQGAIVCTASVAGLRANAGGVDYSASKAGVISIVQTTAYQLYGTGVRINAICPGLIETGMTKPTFDLARERGKEDRIGQINPAKRYGQPSEISEAACFLLSDRRLMSTAKRCPLMAVCQPPIPGLSENPK